jgi:pimeloyl-ACP methyl ester carboxylesterase
MAHHAIQLHRDSASLSGAPPHVAVAEPVPAFLQEVAGESEWYRWHGLKIHYKKVGSGLPVVFLHSVDVGASCAEWRRNLAEIAAGFACHAVDLPGFGQSDVPRDALRADLYLRFVQDFLFFVSKQYPDAPAIRIIASGAGAAYATMIAARQPSLVDRLVLVAPTGLSACNPHPLGALAFHALALPLVSSFQSTVASRSSILEHLQTDVYGDDLRASMNEADGRFWVAHRPGADRVERARLASMLNVSLRPVVKSVKQPVLLIWGRRAKCPPVEDAETWKDLHARTLVGIFEQSGLCPHAEEPTKFNDAATDFLTRDLYVAAEAA